MTTPYQLTLSPAARAVLDLLQALPSGERIECEPTRELRALCDAGVVRGNDPIRWGGAGVRRWVVVDADSDARAAAVRLGAAP